MRLSAILGRPHAIPDLRQAEAAECGLVSVAMIAAYYGDNRDLGSLRSLFSPSMRGSTIRHLIRMSQALGLRTRAIRTEVSSLAKVRLPAIVHWNMDHFVVLADIKRGFRGAKFVIYDPASGRSVVDLDRLSSCFTGVVLEVVPSSNFVQHAKPARFRLRELVPSFVPLRAAVPKTVILGFVIQVSSLIVPLFLQAAVDGSLEGRAAATMWAIALVFCVLSLMGAAADFMRSNIAIKSGYVLSYDMIVAVFSHMMRLSIEWFEKRSVGDVQIRFLGTKPIADFLSQRAPQAIMDVGLAAVTAAFMCIYSPALTLIAAVGLGMMFVVRMALFNRLRRASEVAIIKDGIENNTFLENIRGVKTIKIFGEEINRIRAWQGKRADSSQSSYVRDRLISMLSVSTTALREIERIAVVGCGVWFVAAGRLTLGMVVAFLAYRETFSAAALRALETTVDLRLLRVQVERVADIVTGASDQGSTSHSPEDLCFHVLELKDLCYRYGSGEPLAVEALSMEIRAGEFVVVTGESGSGKTTLLKMILRLVTPCEGSMLLNGVNVDDIDMQAYRGMFGVVSQDDCLFAGTIQENISFFSPIADADHVKHCARLANIHDTISRFPMTYQSLVGDMGASLSGGQRQRVLLARALYRRPKVLIMDEGTSHLDLKNESLIMTGLRELGITLILIAHRPETMRLADRVINIGARLKP